MMQLRSIRSRNIILMLGGVAIAIFYFLFNPSDYSWMPQCLFHKATGLQCMGCGSQRVIHYLLHGNLGAAFKANALVVVAIPFIIFLLWLELSKHSHPHLYKSIHSPSLIIAISALLVAWLILRNLLGI